MLLNGEAVVKAMAVDTEDVTMVGSLVFSETTTGLVGEDSIVERKGVVVGKVTVVAKDVVVPVVMMLSGVVVTVVVEAVVLAVIKAMFHNVQGHLNKAKQKYRNASSSQIGKSENC